LRLPRVQNDQIWTDIIGRATDHPAAQIGFLARFGRGQSRSPRVTAIGGTWPSGSTMREVFFREPGRWTRTYRPDRLVARPVEVPAGNRQGNTPVTVHSSPDGNTSGSIDGMKMSVSLPEDDVEFLDSYARDQGIGSRSAALHKAVGLLRTAQLADAYEDAWSSWTASGEAQTWENTIADGLDS
jgi:Arc/MetJ-type ribon-helix-helix transcriptional regulator